MDDLDKLVAAVCDEESFLVFMNALSVDRADEVSKETVKPFNSYGPGANGWQNGSIEAFLEAAAAWGEGSKDGMSLEIEGFPKWEKPTNPWKRCAEIIYMGKHYE